MARRWQIRCAAITVIMWAVGAHAQQGPGVAAPSGPATSAQSPRGKVEEVVVTAQKRRENLQNVPISITALTARSIKLAGVGNTLDIGAITPGLTETKTSDAPLLFLRGVGTALGGIPGDEGGVNLLVDGVVYTSLPGAVFSLNNISRVEVLRGPQGTLFGRNATGGVVNIITRDPTQAPSADLSVSYGNYNTVSSSAYITGGITPNLAADLAVQYTKQNAGFGTNLYNGRPVNLGEDFAIRSKLLWQPTADTKIRVSVDYDAADSSYGVANRILPGAIGALGEVGPSKFYDSDENIQPFSPLHTGGASIRVEQALPFAQLVSISAYRRSDSGFNFDQDSSPVPLVNATFVNREHQFTQELQIGSLPDSTIKWIAGFFYLNADAKETPLTLSGLAFGPAVFDARNGDIGTQSYAGYAQTTIPIGFDTNITGGLRYTDDNRSFEFSDISGLGIPLLPSADTSKQFDRLTFRAAIDHKITDQVLAYASVSTGFKAGTFNIINSANPPIQPEKLTSYEAGLKTELFDHTLRLNASGFYYDYRNIQVSEIIQGTAFYLNAPGTIYGADVDFEATPLPNLTLSGGFEALRGTYGDFPNAPGTLPLPATCGPNGPVKLPGAPTGGNITCPFNADGNQLVRAPDFTSSFTATYVIPSRVGDFGASGTYAHSARFPWEVDNRLQQNTTNLVNGQIYWESLNSVYAVRLWAKNLTGDQYFLEESSSLGDVGAQAPPRTFGFTLEGHFH